MDLEHLAQLTMNEWYYIPFMLLVAVNSFGLGIVLGVTWVYLWCVLAARKKFPNGTKQIPLGPHRWFAVDVGGRIVMIQCVTIGPMIRLCPMPFCWAVCQICQYHWRIIIAVLTAFGYDLNTVIWTQHWKQTSNAHWTIKQTSSPTATHDQDVVCSSHSKYGQETWYIQPCVMPNCGSCQGPH